MEQWDGCGEWTVWPVSRKHLAHKSPECKTCWSEELITTSTLMDSSPWLLLTRTGAIQRLGSSGNISQGTWVPSCGGDSEGWQYGYCWERHRATQENSTRDNRYLCYSRCIWIGVNVLVKAKKLKSCISHPVFLSFAPCSTCSNKPDSNEWLLIRPDDELFWIQNVYAASVRVKLTIWENKNKSWSHWANCKVKNQAGFTLWLRQIYQCTCTV